MVYSGVELVGVGVVGVISFRGVQFPLDTFRLVLVGHVSWVAWGFDLSSPWSKARFESPPKMTEPSRRVFKVMRRF